MCVFFISEPVMDIYCRNKSSLPNTSLAVDITFPYISDNYVIPTICAFGLLGNVISCIVFTYRYTSHSVRLQEIERSSTFGLLTLAIVDFLFCLITFVASLLTTHKVSHTSKDLAYFYDRYGSTIQNTLLKISTWVTVVLAVGRCLVICQPLHARHRIRLRHTQCALLLGILFWTIIYIPMYWTFEVENCIKNDIIVQYNIFAYYTTNTLIFECCLTVLGFFIPLCVLTFTNIKLIYSLHKSQSIRRSSQPFHSTHSELVIRVDTHPHITISLILIVLMYVLLVSPSEFYQFYTYTSSYIQDDSLDYYTHITNILQVLNLSMNFLLYCMVSGQFRQCILKLIVHILVKLKLKKKSPQIRRHGSVASSFTRSTRFSTSRL